MKFIFGMQINIEVLYKLILSFWVSIGRHAHIIQNKKFAYLCNTSRKTQGIKFIFCLLINAKISYKLIVSFWVCAARYAQITLNKKFVISLQYHKENVKDEVDFFPTDKHQRFLSLNLYYYFRCV